MKRVTRAELRGRKLDDDCKKAHTTSHEFGENDNRVFCLGLCDIESDYILDKCWSCGAFAYNAEPLAVRSEDRSHPFAEDVMMGEGAKMARIKFEPTCSACKRLIHGKIDCETFSEKLCGNVIQDSIIEPSKCPYCGALFEEIVMPVSLPYYNEGEE